MKQKNDISLNNFVQELRENNITEQINNDINADNYKIFLAIIQEAKNKHLPTKKVKFNKYKHKKNKWITRGIFKSIKTKNMIYKQLQQTKPENTEEFETLKVRFKRFHKILRQSIQEAKRTYYLTTFERFKHDIKQTWTIINDTLQRKKKLFAKCLFSQRKSVKRIKYNS